MGTVLQGDAKSGMQHGQWSTYNNSEHVQSLGNVKYIVHACQSRLLSRDSAESATPWPNIGAKLATDVHGAERQRSDQQSREAARNMLV
jgi:hypothetical protein